jgi:predicted DCC family thiol-disulfide oxidoreductase YuxK
MLDQQSKDWEGWVLYDGDCGFCSRWVQFWRLTLERRGITISALQEPWVSERLRRPVSELLSDILLLWRSGEVISGADVYLQITRRIWWAWPFYAVFSLPGFNRLIHAGYRWFARNRYCVSHACRLDPAVKNGRGSPGRR